MHPMTKGLLYGSVFALLTLQTACTTATTATTDAATDAATDATDAAISCCPVSPTPSCCMKYGGTSLGGCVTMCDGMPLPGDPSWVLATDSNGCQQWQNDPAKSDPSRPRCGGISPRDASAD